MSISEPHLATHWRIKVGLTVAGAVAGAAFGIILTPLGKIAAGAPPATLANYVRNAVWFAAMSAVVSPIVAWSTLRRVPLWRTIAEPLGLAVTGGVIGVVTSVPALLLALPPVGLVLGFMHLQRRFREPVAPPHKKSALADMAD
jgi:hypothetical protein